MRKILGVFFIFLMCAGTAKAEEFQCEVLSVTGNATVRQADGSSAQIKEGDLIQKGSTLETNEFSSLNLSFDQAWQNILNLEAQSVVQVGSVAPAKVSLEKGAVFAKLKKLPKDSSFEVTTPTAVAAVRGTEYRTVFKDGETEVFNVSSSEVSVYAVDSSGNPSGEPVILAQDKKTSVANVGEAPRPAEGMSSEESQSVEALKSGIEEKIKEAENSGRVGKIQDVAAIERILRSRGPAQEVESRVVDTRRRPFKKT